MLSIGELARASGLTVSALRFYDRHRILTPAWVDAHTGYRWYAADQVRAARLAAGLRRVGMPLAGIAAAVRADPAAVHGLLDAHLRRLEAGLADARRELSRIRALLDPEEIVMTTRIILSRADLAAAFEAVRFAVGADPGLPQLATVLVDVEADAVTLVATDRYRLAVAGADATVTGPPVRLPVPVDVADRVRELLASATAGEAALTVSADGLTVAVGDAQVTGEAVDVDYPDHRRLVGAAAGTRRATVQAPALRAALTGAPTVVREHDGVRYDVTVLSVDDAGTVEVVGDAPVAGDALRVGINREFLLDALDAAGQAQLVLELDGPITPLIVRRPDDDRSFSLLMPIRL
ncbi:MerR family transcriptional regulator [Micromonospora sp. WMMD882]|uniref:DNA polymerase III subunit beta family protein n=1 Tax=Micromonospora sp. WMMD882 TaxID=3015151 RepID=UPI00248D28B8|nr:MerR family transcriptional regulator [Micromonospora sp. WMMD882]WBB82580.1 MerR family transcriptional regulator [Micromonospora sp. WMMD882]